MNKYIITGGACTGKTAIIDRLFDRGYFVVNEVARDLISEEKLKKEKFPDYNPILPQTDLLAFQYLVIQRQLNLEKSIDSDVSFLDRSLVDSIAYCNVGDCSLGDFLLDLISSANYSKVFYLESLPFYETDSHRQESLGERELVHKELFQVYTSLGFEVVRVPFFETDTKDESIDKRVDYVLQRL